MIKYFSTFSGIGSDEFINRRHQLGWECVGWCEIDKPAQKTYIANHGHENLLYEDITKIDWNKVQDFDVLTGGFPCQSFSMAGMRHGFDDTRGTLFFDLAKCLEIKKPKCFLFENVKGLLSHNNGQTFKRMLDVLKELGYHVQYKLLNTLNFGVPQNRERVFIVGFLDKSDFDFFRFPDYKLSPKALKYYLELSDFKPNISQAEFNRMSVKMKSEYMLGKDFYIVDAGASPRYMAFMKNICPTLKATRCNYVILPYLRKLTPEECFRLQGFCVNEVKKVVCSSQLYKQAGNGWSINVVAPIMFEINRVLCMPSFSRVEQPSHRIAETMGERINNKLCA